MNKLLQNKRAIPLWLLLSINATFFPAILHASTLAHTSPTQTGHDTNNHTASAQTHKTQMSHEEAMVLCDKIAKVNRCIQDVREPFRTLVDAKSTMRYMERLKKVDTILEEIKEEVINPLTHHSVGKLVIQPIKTLYQGLDSIRSILVSYTPKRSGTASSTEAIQFAMQLSSGKSQLKESITKKVLPKLKQFSRIATDYQLLKQEIDFMVGCLNDLVAADSKAPSVAQVVTALQHNLNFL